MTRTPSEQLAHFLSDMYAVEQQALAQLVTAPDMAGDPSLAAVFREHLTETEYQAAMVHDRLEAHGCSPSKIKDAVMKLGGKGFLLFARAMPETPGRLVAHAYSYEAMEWAGYEMLTRFAEAAADYKTAEMAKIIGAQERAMMERLAECFDIAEAASHDDPDEIDWTEEIVKHLTEAHALESQSEQLMKKSEGIAGSALLARIYVGHLEETRQHARLIEARLQRLSAHPSRLKDALLRLGAMNWGLFFQAQSDTPAKLAAFAYAVEHLEIAAYELLLLSARRGLDNDTEMLCERILPEEHAMSERLVSMFDAAVESTLAPAESSAGTRTR
jgi:ferritin-like metal-binding protein YciE